MSSFDLTRANALRIGAAGATALAIVPGSLAVAWAAMNAYLVFDDGSIQGAGPNNGIGLLSFSFGATNAGTQSSGGGAGKTRFSDLQITKPVDATSPKIAVACASGKHFAKLRLVDGGRTTVFDDVIIDSVRKAGGSTDVPTETMTLSYAKIEQPYTPQSQVIQNRGVMLAPGGAPTKKP